MPKISELTTLTAPVTSSDLTVMIRPTAGGGYASFKTRITNIGNLTVTSSMGITGSTIITGSGASMIFSGSGLFGAYPANLYLEANKIRTNAQTIDGMANISLGNDMSLPYRGGLDIWQSGSALSYGSGSTYMFCNFGQTKTPFGGFTQNGYVIRSQYQTTQGSSSFKGMPTASVALWRLSPSFNDQTDNNANSRWVNAIDINPVAGTPDLAYYIVTGSYGLRTTLQVGRDDGTNSTGTYSSISDAGRDGIRVLSGSLFMPSAWGVKLGHLGMVSYTNQVRVGCDLQGDGYIAFGSSSNANGLLSTPDVSASLALVTSQGNIILSTGIGGQFSNSKIIMYGGQSVTGSINSTGYLSLPKGNEYTLGIAVASSELLTGSIAFNTSSMNLVVFTGNGTTTFAGSAGWKVATLT